MIGAALVGLLACEEGAPPDAAVVRDGPRPPDVVLVSLDTTRADATDADTAPNLAALAARGVRFEGALAHAPTTLSSHSSVFTGLDPHRHGVVRNGHKLREDVATLAERFRDAGYATRGVAGASVLDDETGIARGFQLWDTKFTVERERRHEAVAADVTARAIRRAGKRAEGKPLLLFVHYFDAHAPYAAPEPWTRKFGDPAYAGPFDGTPTATKALGNALKAEKADPADLAEARARYRGEVAYADAELGRLLATLELHDPIVAVFGDHGEMLGEERERPIGHGADVDLPATHVPLVIAGPGVPAGVRVEGAVGLQDLGATLLALAGVGGGLGDGVDLAPLWAGAPADRLVPMEATQPDARERKDAWPNLSMERGVARGSHLLVAQPWLDEPPRLYGLAPGQPPVDDAEVRGELDAALRTWDAKAPGYAGADVSPEMDEALRALGYRE